MFRWGGAGAWSENCAPASGLSPRARPKTASSPLPPRARAPRPPAPQLDEEATRNALARAQIGVLGALSEARLGMHRMMAVHLAPAHGAAGPAEADLAAARQSLQRMDELCDAVHRALLAAPPQPARPACGAAASGAPSASGCTASTAESAMGQRRAPSGAGAAGGALGTGASADVLRAPDAYRAPLQSYDCRRVGMGVPLSEMLRR